MTVPTVGQRRSWSARLAWAAAAVVPIAFLLVFFAYPVGSIIEHGFREGSILDVVRRTRTGRLLWFTTWQAILSTVVTFVIGLPAAWAIGTMKVPARRIIRALLIVPFVLPTLVVAAALRAVFEVIGLDLNHSVLAIVIAHAMLNAAVVIRIVGGYWSLLDHRSEEAARVLGASWWRATREVTLPALAPALWSAAAIVFLFCFTSFGIILTVGGPANPTIETEIWRYAVRRTEFAAAAALAVIQLVAVVALIVTTNVLERRTQTGGTARPRSLRPIRSRRQKVAVSAALLPASIFLLVPLGVLLERSLSFGGGYGFGHYRALSKTSGGTLFVPAADAIGNSLWAASAACFAAVVIGGLASVLVVHRRWGRALDVGLMVPLGTSAVTVGFGMLVAFGTPPVDWRSSWALIPLAQALVGIPFVIRSVVPALRSVDERQREAAAVLGASPRKVRMLVDGPVAVRALLVGAAFSFAISLGEFGATSFLVRPERPTVPTAMFRLLSHPGEALQGQAMALGTVLAVLSALSVLVIERLRPNDAVGW